MTPAGPTQSEVEAIVARLTPNDRKVIQSLGIGYTPAPRAQTRQLTASVTRRHGDLIEREWQDGCAQCTYYRLTPLGLAVKNHLQRAAALSKLAALDAETMDKEPRHG